VKITGLVDSIFQWICSGACQPAAGNPISRAMNGDLQAALASLPHGTSFRFVDRIVSLDGGKSGSAVYQLKGNEAFLEGHFPGNPMMPGVILIEAIAQLGGVVSQCDPNERPLDDMRLTAIRAAKILGAAVPGDVLEIQVTVEGRLGGLIQLDGEISVRGNLLAKAKVTLSGKVQG
jgi:3-hydroxyacyl-[acyl-carrier-protein] dehydratase